METGENFEPVESLALLAFSVLAPRIVSYSSSREADGGSAPFIKSKPTGHPLIKKKSNRQPWPRRIKGAKAKAIAIANANPAASRRAPKRNSCRIWKSTCDSPLTRCG